MPQCRRDDYSSQLGSSSDFIDVSFRRQVLGLRRCEHVKYDPKGLHEFTVHSREPGTEHRLTRNMFDAWLRRPGGSPADVARKNRLKELLGDVRI